MMAPSPSPLSAGEREGVRGDNGRISWFWMGHRTHLESRVPFFGDRVRIEYVKDRLGRNAVTQIKVLR